MRKGWLVAVAVAAALSGCSGEVANTASTAVQTQASVSLPAGVTLVESYAPKAGEIGIPFNKYQLANGLTVILHQDHSDPLVHVDVTYHVGSDREYYGRTGFAHLFEHMMFQGSEHVADEQHIKTVTEAGGSMNGTTNTDRTNYFETVPSNQLEKMLWLESDRMGFLLPALTDEKFEVQRATVKNERGQRVDNRPYGRVGEVFDQAFYPAGHPYSWPVIGWPADLDRATSQDVRDFFSRWYGPNNATLTIGGDLNEAQTLAWVNKYFGEIPRGPEVTSLAKPLVTLDKTRYVSFEDNVHLPLLQIGFPTVYARHEDEAPLDVLASILGGGETSILYKNLVKDGYAVQAQASHGCSELACRMAFIALANPAKGGALAPIEAKVRESIQEFEARGVTDEDIDKVKMQIRSQTIYGLQSVSGKVSSLASNETFTGEPNQVEYDLKRYGAVTKADVMRVYNQYIKGKPSVVLSVVPKGGEALIAAADNFTPTNPPVADKAVEGLTEEKPQVAQSSFDRNIEPPAGEPVTLHVPELWRSKLANNVEVMGTQSTETPTTSLVIYFDGGHKLEALSKAGLASLTADVLNDSTAKHSTEELAQQLDLLGARISFSANDYQSSIRVTALTENLDATIALLKEKLLEPGFVAADFERDKQQMLQMLQHESSSPSALASKGFSKMLFGDDMYLGVSANGTLSTVPNITLADVKAFYQKQYTAGNAQIVAVSDLPQASLMQKLAPIAALTGPGASAPTEPANTLVKANTVYLIDKPGAAQSVIRVGKLAMTFDVDGDYFKSTLMNYPLGGAFNSRINLNLREDKGYTYGARSMFVGGKEQGYFYVGADVRADVTDKALAEVMKEISRYHAQGMTAAELKFTQNSISQSKAMDYESPYDKAGFIRTIQRYDLPVNYIEQQDKILANANVEQLSQLAQKWLDPQSMGILVVGDKATVQPGLEALGYKVVDMTL
ncbi:insulinase family protein [Shewanella sp. C32]|uniref:Insulinase family protein n=1 Tax=Shewanella electrica TaxID=515560 RepID=A0ABT2FG77_9GAMM|nr:pitrilysin family protein [Shewanella electrica]MCH1923216.1 insulinase family protein [Shewanella electrica]MCS4555313.1 insulinase family protein [Shewanella electrica]